MTPRELQKPGAGLPEPGGYGFLIHQHINHKNWLIILFIYFFFCLFQQWTVFDGKSDGLVGDARAFLQPENAQLPVGCQIGQIGIFQAIPLNGMGNFPLLLMTNLN